MNSNAHLPLCRGNLSLGNTELLQHEVLFVVMSDMGTAYLHRTLESIDKFSPHKGAVAYVSSARWRGLTAPHVQYDKVKDTVYIPSSARINRFLILHGKVDVQGNHAKGWKPPATGGIARPADDYIGAAYHLQTINIVIEPTMKPIEISTKTLVNGQDLDSLTDDALYTMIRKAESRIKELSEIENKPAKLTAEIEAHKAGIKALVDLMDGRVAKP